MGANFRKGDSPMDESPMKRNKKQSFLWSEMKDWVTRKFKKEVAGLFTILIRAAGEGRYIFNY